MCFFFACSISKLMPKRQACKKGQNCLFNLKKKYIYFGIFTSISPMLYFLLNNVNRINNNMQKRSKIIFQKSVQKGTWGVILKTILLKFVFEIIRERSMMSTWQCME